MAAEAIFSLVLENLAQLAMEEAKFVLGVTREADKLAEKFKNMSWFLREGAANQEGAKTNALEWVIKLRDLLYEAEDVIETYAIKVKSRRGGGVTRKIKRFACLLNECYLRHQIGSDIESILGKINDLMETMKDLGIIERMEKKDVGPSRLSQLRRTYSIVNSRMDLLVGMDEDIRILVGRIIGGENPAVSICGVGGIGKTTLARKVYHDSSVRSHFDVFLWICVSQQWEKKDLLRRILTGLLAGESIEELTDEDKQVKKIYTIMESKKCIIVLDDVWSVDVWQNLQPAISVGNRGSKVLVTTRSEIVAKCIDAQGYIHRPQFLKDDESWTLFYSKALQHHEGCPEFHIMEKFRREMFTHCGGLPLALVVLGGILASKSSDEEWEAVHKSVKAYLRKGRDIGEHEGDLHKILALSYNDLPYELKPCFLYLSKYAEDQEIEAVALYHIWMAEGMILSKHKNSDHETMMAVAERYLENLAERCMIFVEVKEGAMFKRSKVCRLHDVMRDLCISKAKEEKFLEFLVNGSSTSNNTVGASSASPTSTTTTSRLAVYSIDNKRVEQPAKEVSRHLRSFSISVNRNRHMAPMLKFDEFVMLKLLMLEGLDTFGEGLKLHASIGKLLHLRYLSLRHSTFGILPSSISNLSQLETLGLRIRGILRIYNVMWKLRSLKHLYLPEGLKLFHGKTAARCSNSSTLRLDGLTKLEILDGFCIDKYCHTIHLSTLTNLRSLRARPHSKCLQEFINQVSNLTYVQFLEIEVYGVRSEMPALLLEMIFSLASLEHLILHGNVVRALPVYRGSIGQNLLKLSLTFREGMETDPFRTLEKLQELRKLELFYLDGRNMTCHGMGFQKLKSLCIGYASYLETWEIENGAMPHLSQLTICGCDRLKMIPDGLPFLTSLKELVIQDMPPAFTKRIKVNAYGGGGEDFHKVTHIHKVIVEEELIFTR